jgi:hypothetical protein
MLKHLWEEVAAYSYDIARCLQGNTPQDPTTAAMRPRFVKQEPPQYTVTMLPTELSRMV